MSSYYIPYTSLHYHIPLDCQSPLSHCCHTHLTHPSHSHFSPCTICFSHAFHVIIASSATTCTASLASLMTPSQSSLFAHYALHIMSSQPSPSPHMSLPYPRLSHVLHYTCFVTPHHAITTLSVTALRITPKSFRHTASDSSRQSYL